MLSEVEIVKVCMNSFVGLRKHMPADISRLIVLAGLRTIFTFQRC